LLFGPARSAAGTATDQAPAASVPDLLEWAAARYGPAFAALLPTCRVWVNGQPASETAALAEDDEVAIIPPVSGG
jgi:molybdopterin converting factor small subunit